MIPCSPLSDPLQDCHLMGFLNRRPSILVKSASKIRLPRKLAEFWHGSWRGPQLQPAAAARYPQPAAYRGSLQQPPQSQQHAARNPPQPQPARSRTLYSACPVLRLEPHPLCVAADAAACSSRSMVQVAIGSKRMQSAAASRQPATRFIWFVCTGVVRCCPVRVAQENSCQEAKPPGQEDSAPTQLP